MRILHLIDSGGVYGAERILLYLAREQQRSGDEPFLGSIGRPGAGCTALEALAQVWGIPVLPIRIEPKPTPRVVRTLLDQARALKTDLMHSHGYKSNILLGPVPRRIRGPMITTLHGWTDARRYSALWVYECLDSWAIRSIDSVVAVTRSMFNLPAVQRIAPSRRHLIENGIPSRAVRLEDLKLGDAGALPTAVTDIMAQSPTLIAIGRLSPEKAFGNLIDAFAKARMGGNANFKLIIAGEGRERGALTGKIADLGLEHAVLLPGYLEGADRLLEHAAGFVMSSLTEGLPLVLLEAMQWRVPILATSVGAIPELLDHGSRGQLVAPGSVDELAQGLRRLMSPGDTARSQGIELAYAAGMQRYTSERMADEYRRLYLQIG
jgi:glycosyltransferase involved in cell wall biosynthesis